MSLPLAMRPAGLLGRPFGWVMEYLNRPVYRKVLDALSLEADHRLLEIGCGTGGFLKLAGETVISAEFTGIDPAILMVEQTRKRLNDLPDINATIRLGTDRCLEQFTTRFDRVVAIHSFQFWEDPEETLAHIYRLMPKDGVLCLALRRHATPAPGWLPNPLSKREDELERTQQLLVEIGFGDVRLLEETRHSAIIRAKT